MKRSDILTTVRALINDAAVEDDTFTQETDAALQEFVRIALTMLAANEGVEADASSMTSSNTSDFHVRPDGLYYAVIALPDDFMRFVSVKLEGWPYPVSRLMPDTSALYQAQYTTSKGVGNGPQVPVAFISEDTSRRIIAHAVKSVGGYTLRYIPQLTVKEDGYINLREKYAGALAYYTAALYHNSVNEREISEAELTIARNLASRVKREEVTE